MAEKQIIAVHQSSASSQTPQPPEAPLQLEEMLTLIKFADELGYSVKNAKGMTSLYDEVSSDLYSVWFAIENELSLFTHNIFDLIEFTGWERYKSKDFEDNIEVIIATA